MKDYDSSRSLENFLYIHLNNRLKNFKRDNYYRYEVGAAHKIQETKKSILEPIDIHELFDYLKLKNKGKITKARKNKVIKKIQEIIDGKINNEEG
jgi:hypothetical protein